MELLLFRTKFHKCNCCYLELNFTNVTVAIGAWSVVPFVVWALEEDDTVWRTDPIGVTRAPVCPGETLRMSLPHKLSVPWCISPAYPIVTWCVFCYISRSDEVPEKCIFLLACYSHILWTTVLLLAFNLSLIPVTVIIPKEVARVLVRNPLCGARLWKFYWD